MPKNKSHVVILGAGPAGIGAAFQLTKQEKANVTVLEMKDTVGGNAGSFEMNGIHFDYGSHRLHPACQPDILSDIRDLLGDDLLVRPRHGRIRLNNCWIHFPLVATELATRLPLGFSIGVFSDAARKLLPTISSPNGQNESFASVLQKKLGKTICEEFYFPYARKIWGMPPEEISVVQAEKRVSANSFGKLIKKVLGKSKSNNANGRPIFYYPKYGYGQISEELFRQAEKNGATFVFNARVKNIFTENEFATAVVVEKEGEDRKIKADFILSSLPMTLMVKGLEPQPEGHILEAADKMRFRAMILIYLLIEKNRFTEFDAHYFPEIDIPITRLSEVKNYSDTNEPEDLTGICAELPCDPDDHVWNMSNEELSKLVKDSLRKADIPITSPIKRVFVKRLKHAYPIYNRGFETNYHVLDEYLQNFKNLITFGRQGLFVHDNTHHALYMAYSAAECIGRYGDFDRDKWIQYRHEFESHVVED